MHTPRELALQAIRIAEDLGAGDVVSFAWSETNIDEVYKVTLWLTDGQIMEYDIRERLLEGGDSSGVSPR